MKYVASMVIAIAALCNANVFAGEGKIRQAHQNLIVEGRASQPLLFTTTGHLTDVVAVHRKDGSLRFCMTLGQLANSQFALDRVLHSGGETSVRVCLPNPGFPLHQGTVTIYRGQGIVDRDRIVLR